MIITVVMRSVCVKTQVTPTADVLTTVYAHISMNAVNVTEKISV